MEITFKHNKLKRSLTEAGETRKTYGVLAKRISQRMESLYAADNLSVLQSLPALECHPLSGDRLNEWAIRVSGNWRIIFELNENPIPRLDNNTMDVEKIIHIRIVEITDYH